MISLSPIIIYVHFFIIYVQFLVDFLTSLNNEVFVKK